jgi:hypothetical protein
MRKFITYTVVMLLSLSISLAPVSALAMEERGDVFVFRSEPSGEAMIGDALIVRPVSLVCLGVSSLVFLIGWPFAAAGGNEDQAKQALLKDPVQYTFKRPLGDF